MLVKTLSTCLARLCLLGAALVGALSCTVPPWDRMVVAEKADAYEITVPVSHVQMSVPKAGFVPVRNPPGAADSARYFYLADQANHIYISGWFEPASRFPGVKSLWSEQVQDWQRRGLPQPQSSAFLTLGEWEAVSYELVVPELSGHDCHIRAHHLQGETWIDLHLSALAANSCEEGRAPLAALLKSIRITEKSS